MFPPKWLRSRRPFTIRRQPPRSSRYVRPQLEGLEERITPAGPIILQAANTSQLQADVLTADSNPTQQYVIQLTGPSPYNLTTELDIYNTAGVTITGSSTALNAARASRVFLVESLGNLTLQDLTVEGGRVTSQGGGILDLGGTVALTNVIVQSNTVSVSPGLNAYGGGIYVSAGTLTIKNSTIQGNSAFGGDGASGTQRNPTGGTGGSGQGGGVFSTYSKITILSSSVTANSVHGGNGGVGRNGTSRTGIISNQNGGTGGYGGSGQGGGVYATNSAITITSSSLTNNTAQGGLGGNGGIAFTLYNIGAKGGSGGAGGAGQGGGLYANGPSLQFTLVNSAVSGNDAQGGDGGQAQNGAPRTGKATSLEHGGTGGNGGSGGIAQGGGIYLLSDSSASFTNDSITSNNANGGGDTGGGGGGAGGSGAVRSQHGAGGAGGNGGSGGWAMGGGVYTTGSVNLINITVAKNSVSVVGGGGGGGGGGGYIAGAGGGGGVGGTAEGGGVYDQYFGQNTYINDTFANNTATGTNGFPGGAGGRPNGNTGAAGYSANAYGGGFYFLQSSSGSPNAPTFNNNLLQGNSINDPTGTTGGPDYYGAVNSGATNNFVSNTSGASTFVNTPTTPNVLNSGTNQLGTLTTASNGTSYYPLLPFTQSINGGNNNFLPTIASAQGVSPSQATDQIGNPREVNTIIDIGDIEFQGIPTMLTVANINLPYSPTNQNVTLGATVQATGYTVNEGSVTFTVVDPTGKVVVGPVATPVVNGQANVTVMIPGGTPAASYTIQASYADPVVGNFNSSSNTGTLTVQTVPITVNVAPSSLTIQYSLAGQNLTLSAAARAVGSTVNEGTVTFVVLDATGKQVGTAVSASIVNGQTGNVIYVLPASTPAGTYTIQATYTDPTNDYGSFSATGTLIVQSAPVTFTFVPPSLTTQFSFAGQDLVLSTSVETSNGLLVNAGTVAYTIRDPQGNQVGNTVSAPVLNGVATTTYVLPAATPAGTYTITAVFSDPAADFTSSSSTGTLTVDPIPTSVSVSSVTVPFTSADPMITLNATVTAPRSIVVNEGQVQFVITSSSGVVLGSPVTGNVQNGQANATFAVPAEAALGAYTITANYSDPTNNLAASSGAGTLTIVTSSTSVVVNNVSIVYGLFSEQETLTAVVFNALGQTVNEGFVTFSDSGQSVTVPIVNSLATGTLNIPLFSENPFAHSITAAYSASTNNFLPSTSLYTLEQTLMDYLLQIMALEFYLQSSSGNMTG